VATTRTNDPPPYLIPLDYDGAAVLSIDTSEQCAGWSAYFSDAVTQAGALVLVLIAAEPQPGRGAGASSALEVRELRIIVEGRVAGFASGLLRDIPVMRIEAAINQMTHRRRLLARVLAHGRAVDEPPGGIRYRQPPTRPPAVQPASLTIDDPGGYRKPDEFYQRVAALYLHLAAVSSRPAHELAEANHVPVATVHRWIREAKARQLLLLPAHRGAYGSRASGLDQS
jgi:hypothetical protein